MFAVCHIPSTELALQTVFSTYSKMNGHLGGGGIVDDVVFWPCNKISHNYFVYFSKITSSSLKCKQQKFISSFCVLIIKQYLKKLLQISFAQDNFYWSQLLLCVYFENATQNVSAKKCSL